MLRFDNRVWLLWAALLLLLPLKWLVAAVSAAIFHELFHAAAVYMLGGSICIITIAPFGAIMETEGIEGLREGLCALAGPLGSFCLSLGIHRFPMLGLCALVQGIFNLLPVYPLDGGRALTRLLEYSIPEHSGTVCKWVEGSVLFLLLRVVMSVSLRYHLGVFPLFFCVFTIANALLRKRP